MGPYMCYNGAIYVLQLGHLSVKIRPSVSYNGASFVLLLGHLRAQDVTEEPWKHSGPRKQKLWAPFGETGGARVQEFLDETGDIP